MVFLTPRLGSSSSRAPGGSGQRAKAPPPIRVPTPVAAATPGSQPWSPSPPSSSRLRGNKERRRSRSNGVVAPLRPHHGGCLAITLRLPTRPPPPPASVRALGPPGRSGPLPGSCRRPGPRLLGLSLRATATTLWAPSTPRPEPLWRAALAFASPTTASPTLLPPPAVPTWLPSAAMVRSTSAPKPQIQWYSPSRMAALTSEAFAAIFIEGKAKALPTVLIGARRVAALGASTLIRDHRPHPPLSFYSAVPGPSHILSSACGSLVPLPSSALVPNPVPDFGLKIWGAVSVLMTRAGKGYHVESWG